MISTEIKSKIESIVHVFETGSPNGAYDAIAIFKDYTNPETKQYSSSKGTAKITGSLISL